MAGASKLALDFLLRPTTMTLRPASRYQALYKKQEQDGGNPLGDGNTIAAREDLGMAVWSMRRLQCLLCEQFTLFCAEVHRRTRGNVDK
jgi:hypothetical protein